MIQDVRQTVRGLQDHLDLRFESFERKLDERCDSLDQKLDRGFTMIDRRFGGIQLVTLVASVAAVLAR